MNVHALVMERCTAVEAASQIHLTGHAKRLIADILAAIVVDPHPSWQSSPAENHHVFKEFVSRLDAIVKDMAPEANPPHPVSSFDVLHYLSRRLDMDCPFAKAPVASGVYERAG